MIQLRTILFPTDFSEQAREAGGFAWEFAEKFNSHVHVLHILHDLSSAIPEFGMGVNLVSLKQRLSEQSHKQDGPLREKLLQEVPESFRAENSTVTVAHGAPFVEIVRYARTHDIDLIVMGTHGRGILGHALMGSVAENVVRKAPCPVLTIRPSGHTFSLP